MVIVVDIINKRAIIAQIPYALANDYLRIEKDYHYNTAWKDLWIEKEYLWLEKTIYALQIEKDYWRLWSIYFHHMTHFNKSIEYMNYSLRIRESME